MRLPTRKPSRSDDRTVVLGSTSWESLWEQAVPLQHDSLRREDGWRTAQDEARRMGTARSTAEKRLMALTKEGVLERRMGRGGRNVPTAFYRPKARP